MVPWLGVCLRENSSYLISTPYIVEITQKIAKLSETVNITLIILKIFTILSLNTES